MIEKYTIYSNAKVSTYANIIGKKDGKWIIETIILPIELYDVIEVGLTNEMIINVDYKDNKNIIRPSNECTNAIEDLMSLRTVNKGVDIHIQKNIPIASGLGGESTNIVSILYCLNLLLKLNIDIVKLMDLCYKYGNDTLFFTYNHPAYMVSKKIYPIPIISKKVPYLCLLINPDIHFSTHKTKYILSKNFNICNDTLNIGNYLQVWGTLNLDDINNSLMNFIKKNDIPEYEKAFIISEEIYEVSGYRPIFTGSGPFLFLFVDERLKQIVSSYCEKKYLEYYVAKLL